MFKSDFLKAGHTPTLIASFLYFDLAFMVWVHPRPARRADRRRPANSTHAQKGLMVATPVLAGALLRIVMGVMVDQLKPKMAGTIGQVIVMVALFVAWQHGIHSYEQTLILGIFLGVAGASFAAALPLASRWYPPEHQGTAMGIAGAGNSGTALAALFAPSLAIAFGWNNVFGLALIPLAIVLRSVSADGQGCAGMPGTEIARRVLHGAEGQGCLVVHVLLLGHLRRLRRPGLVARPSTSTRSTGSTPRLAGFFTAACVFAGSLVRPIGGNVADRIGGVKSLYRDVHAARRCSSPSSASACPARGWRWPASSAPCCASAWATARCSSWCRSAFARRSAS